jgi:hypothetical protein
MTTFPGMMRRHRRTKERTMQGAQTANDGRHDFDFLFGRRRIHNRKLVDTLDPDATEWVEFDALGDAWPILGGLGNVDTFSVAALPPTGAPFEGFTLRLFEPGTRRWRIWWASTRFPGDIGVPVEGAFDGPRGEFLSDEVIAGRPTKVRFEWRVLDDGVSEWEQSFSWDGGGTWVTNWTSTHRTVRSATD